LYTGNLIGCQEKVRPSDAVVALGFPPREAFVGGGAGVATAPGKNLHCDLAEGSDAFGLTLGCSTAGGMAGSVICFCVLGFFEPGASAPPSEALDLVYLGLVIAASNPKVSGIDMLSVGIACSSSSSRTLSSGGSSSLTGCGPRSSCNERKRSSASTVSSAQFASAAPAEPSNPHKPLSSFKREEEWSHSSSFARSAKTSSLEKTLLVNNDAGAFNVGSDSVVRGGCAASADGAEVVAVVAGAAIGGFEAASAAGGC